MIIDGANNARCRHANGHFAGNRSADMEALIAAAWLIGTLLVVDKTTLGALFSARLTVSQGQLPVSLSQFRCYTFLVSPVRQYIQRSTFAGSRKRHCQCFIRNGEQQEKQNIDVDLKSERRNRLR